jgi:hypothetical protein
MPEKTKREKDTQKQKEKGIEKPFAVKDENDKDTWDKDQLEKSYYYDDAHGYEIYNPDEDEEED